MPHTPTRLLPALVLLAIALPSLADVPPKRPMTFEDLWGVRRVGPPSMAPDGKWCVVDVTSYDIEKDDSTSELWLLATDGKSQRQLTSSGGKNSGPVWSPDGQWIAFTSKRGTDESAQVYVISPIGGEAKRLTHMPMAPAALKWAADSSKILCIVWTWPDTPTDDAYKKREKELKDAKSKAMVIDDAAFRYWDKWIADGKRPYAFAVDAKTGEHKNLMAQSGKNLPPYEPTAHDYDVAPDGKELCFVAENVKEIGLDNNHDLYTLALDREAAKPVDITADNPAQDTSPVYSPDGRHIAFTRQSTKFFYADRIQVMLHERGGGTRSLTSDFDYSCTNPKWMPDNKRLYFDVEQRGFHRVGLTNIEKPSISASGPNASERSMDVAKRD